MTSEEVELLKQILAELQRIRQQLKEIDDSIIMSAP